MTLMARARNSGVGMPFKVVSGAGVGAAAVFVGLSLAGPQALGVANADTAATDSTSVSAGPADPSAVSARSAAGRGGRGVKPSGSTGSRVRPRASADVTSAQQTPVVEAARRSVRGSVSVRSVAAVADRRKSASVRSAAAAASGLQPESTSAEWARSAGRGDKAAVGVAINALVVGHSATDVAVSVPEVPAATASAVAGRTYVRAVPSRSQGEVTDSTAAGFATVPDHVQYLVESFSRRIADSLHSFFDSATNWLATVPEGPVTDFLSGALLLARRTLLPTGYDLGVSAYNPPTEIAPDFPTEGCQGGSSGMCFYNWYDVATNYSDAGRNIRLGPVLRGTNGAVFTGQGGVGTSDGVKGIITNMTNQPIVVATTFVMGPVNPIPKKAMAILLPNDWMPYQLNESTLDFYAINLTTYKPNRLPEPSPQTGRAQLYLKDPFFGTASANFFANGQSKGDFSPREGEVVNFVGDGYDTGDIRLTVRRLEDGSWDIPTSAAYLHRYYRPPDNNKDWAIFNIDIKRLPNVN